MENKKLKNIEFLRFIFAILIIHSHILWLLLDVYQICPGLSTYTHLFKADGFLCVEYFFIVSGYFLYNHCVNKQSTTLDFAINKLKRLYPLFLFSYVLIYLLSLFIPITLCNHANFMNLFMLTSTLVYPHCNNGYSWFICVLFFVLIFYHYLYRNYAKKTVNLIIFITVLISYTMLLNKYGGGIPGTQDEVFSILRGSIIRGLGGIGVGYIIGLFTEKISDFIHNYNPKLLGKLTIGLLEIYLLFFIINNSVFHSIHYKNDFIFVIVFSILFILFIFKKGFFSKILDNNISAYLGSFSYALYIMQVVGFYTSKYYIWDNKAFVYAHPYINWVISLSICIGIGIMSHLFVYKILKYISFFKSPKLSE